MSYSKPKDRPRGFAAARLIDVIAALVAITVLSPVLVFRAMTGRASSGRWLETTPALGLDCHLISLLDFAGSARGRSLVRVFNLLQGDLALGGPAPARIGDRGRWLTTAPGRFAVRPGLIAPQAPGKLMGLAAGSEAAADLEFSAGHRAMSGLLLLVRWVVARCVAGPADRPARAVLHILGVTLTNTTMDEAVAWLTRRARDRMRTTAAFANPDSHKAVAVIIQIPFAKGERECTINGNWTS